jgi:hypothetical protein
MKRNTIAAILVVILGGSTFWMISRRDRSSLKKELRDFAVQDTASITKIFLADKTLHQVTLTKEKQDGRTFWMVDGKYEARADAILYLLRTIHDLSVKEPVSNKSKDNVVKQLATGSVKCQIYAGDKLIKQYYVGGGNQEENGTYMLLSDISDPEDPINSTEPFVMEIKGFEGYLTTRYSTRVSEWRDRTMFRYFAPDIRSIKVEHQGDPAASFVVTQSSDLHHYAVRTLDGKDVPLDTIAVRQFISYFANIHFENFETSLTPAQQDSVKKSPWAHRISVTDASNRTNTVTMFLKKNDGYLPEDTTATAPSEFDPDRMFATVNEGKDFVGVQYYVMGKLLITPEYFIPRKRTNAPAAAH